MCYVIFRLPIIQGGTYSFLTPVFAILALPKWKCPDLQSKSIKFYEQTYPFYPNTTDNEKWLLRTYLFICHKFDPKIGQSLKQMDQEIK